MSMQTPLSVRADALAHARVPPLGTDGEAAP